MKIKNALIIVLLALGASVQAQTYTFEQLSGTYANLSQSISINNNMTWDDPQFTIPIGFDFQYAEQTINQIFIEDFGLGGLLATDTSETGVIPLLIPYGVDIIDRAFDLSTGAASGSLSPLSYQLDGTVGSRILKIEWNNAGFYYDVDADSISTDFINFQLWLYEGSNDIEIHYGPSLITQPSLVYEEETGPVVGLMPQYDANENELVGDAYTVAGNPEKPFLKIISTLDDLPFLEGDIPDGTIYRFASMKTGTVELKAAAVQVAVYPNPVTDFLQIKALDSLPQIEQVEIRSINGQIVKQVRDFNRSIAVADLVAGIYTIQLHTEDGIISKKFVKN